MKKIIVALVVLMILSVGVAAFAQGGVNTAKERGKHPGILRDIGLSKEQTKEIRGIVKQFRLDAKTVAQSNVPKEEKKSKFQALKDKAVADINAVLDPTQQEKAKQLGLIDRLLSFNKERVMRMQMVLKQLNLTDSQKATIKGILQENSTAAQAIKDNKSLSNEARKSQLKQLRDDTRQKIRASLDPEQQKKLDELLARNPKQFKAGKQK